MTTDQLRAYLDAHGVDGDPLHPGWHVVESADGAIGFCVVIRDRGGSDWTTVGFSSTSVGIMVRGFVRHAPLPDLGAMARELAGMRARVPAVCDICGGSGSHGGALLPVAMCEACSGSGAVWVAP